MFLWHVLCENDILPLITFDVVFYLTECGGNLTSPSGNFQSPYFPNPYPHKKRCIWKITVPPGNFITLTFPTFNIEPTANCIYDYVSVRNGPDEASPYMGRFCGSSPPTPLTSSMNQLTVIFNTDESQTFGGFNASYRSAPGGKYELYLFYVQLTHLFYNLSSFK